MRNILKDYKEEKRKFAEQLSIAKAANKKMFSVIEDYQKYIEREREKIYVSRWIQRRRRVLLRWIL